jgi:hypothetical protein
VLVENDDQLRANALADFSGLEYIQYVLRVGEEGLISFRKPGRRSEVIVTGVHLPRPIAE